MLSNIDTALAQLKDRLNQDGLAMYEKLEKCLLTAGEINDAVMQYPEIDAPVLQIQLQMFRMQFK